MIFKYYLKDLGGGGYKCRKREREKVQNTRQLNFSTILKRLLLPSGGYMEFYKPDLVAVIILIISIGALIILHLNPIL